MSMNAILDVCYGNAMAVVACVQFRDWTDSQASAVNISEVEIQADYVPGRFFERELPCLLHAIERVSVSFEVIVIDGYVHLKPPHVKGLGFHLAETVSYPVAVIGVAKSPLKVADQFVPVFRGRSRRPLFVSAIQLPTERAAALIESMSGPFRVPTLIKMADRLCRGG
jgi:deoxyribonuclease V